MARNAEQHWRRLIVFMLFISSLVFGIPRADADIIEIGFLAAAQRAQLVIVSKVRYTAVGLFGCGHRLDVQQVLRGSVDGDYLDLNARGSRRCPELPYHHRLVMAFDRWREDVSRYYPEAPNWYASIGEDDYVIGNLSGCYWVTSGEVRSTKAPERMRLEDLSSLLSDPTDLVCGYVERPESHYARREIEGQIRDFYDRPMWARVELAPAGYPDLAIAISTDESGSFHFSEVPIGPVWLQISNGDFEPILVQAGATKVRILIPSCSSRAVVWAD